MKRLSNIILIVLLAWLQHACTPIQKNNVDIRDHTSFQESGRWDSLYDVRCDIVMMYGINPDFEKNMKVWQERGYKTEFMTGIAWGGYHDYFNGEWDGKQHWDDGQVRANGDTLWHGSSKTVAYIVPSKSFLEYMKETRIKRVIDAGITDIYLEEPEFWARAGYSESFKREWKDYYGFDWRAPEESVENTYLSNKLKYYLYYRALNECFTYAKEYGKSLGKDIKCYVPTHSLINYSQWKIVSPEASLASLPCVDGYIGQIWTGTSREPNYYNGTSKERVFETAFMEYGCMESMTAPTHRRVYFLTDPIEDRVRDWEDYIRNYAATLTAELLYPKNNYYEVMPWPSRIYKGLYNKSADSDEKALMPRFYSTQLQVICNALNNMPLSENKVSGTNGISLLMANSLMFQHAPAPANNKQKGSNAGSLIDSERTNIQDINGYSDPLFSNFFGLSMPFVKHGVPLQLMHIENVSYPETWEGVKVLMMTYSNMKPLEESAHQYIADWVKDGGILVYIGRDKDPFQNVQEWWNQGKNKFSAPSQHLFKLMGMQEDAGEGEYTYGKGTVCVIRKDPKEMAMTNGGANELIAKVKHLYDKAENKPLELKNSLYLERGPYSVIAVMDENEDKSPYICKGKFIDLFDHTLPIITEKVVEPGKQALLFDIDRVKNPDKPQILAAASRAYDEVVKKNSYSFIVKAPTNTTNAMRILLPKEPKSIKVSNHQGEDVEFISAWDEFSKTSYLQFENSHHGMRVNITY